MRTAESEKRGPRRSLALVLAASALLSACTSGQYTLESARSRQTDTDTGDEADTAAVTFTLTNVTVQNGTGGSARLFFNAASTESSMTDVCATGAATGTTNTRACECVFRWDQMNTTGAEVVPVPREAKGTLTNVQSHLAECTLPSVWATEIPDKTEVRVSIVGSTGNSNSFRVREYRYTKNGAAVTGSFQDAEGRAFDNVLRYSCFEQFRRGTELKNRITKAQNPTNPNDTVDVPSATDFCFELAAGGGNWDAELCGASKGLQNSAQSYYYNLYVRSTDKGSINLGNQRFTCPLVREALNSSNGNGDYWPLDSQFALALTPSAAFPVGIEAAVRADLGNGQPVVNRCFEDSSGGAGGTGDGTQLTTGCLGFAAKPARDGTCGTFRDASGTVRPTFRLRRYRALYPPLYDTNGKVIPGAQGQDLVYVLDRPVTVPGGDPLKPYTMAGPKPCPFAYFDHQSVINGTAPPAPYPAGKLPQYAATNNAGWAGKNIDGIQFPNVDDAATRSCSAALPVLNPDGDIFTLASVNAANPKYPEMHVRGEKPWAPYYVEDTAFEACAPMSTAFRDPPLHFARDSASGNVSWCAEAYPSQNPFVSALEAGRDTTTQQLGYVRPFTSHVSKNTTAGQCSATVLAPGITGYSAGDGTACTAVDQGVRGAARHPSFLLADRVVDTLGCPSGFTAGGDGYCYACANRTCDRSVQASTLGWRKFPLLAPPEDVEAALVAEPENFGCLITYDAGNGKTGKFSPREGCCGASVRVWTATTTGANGHPTAHLEPTAACQSPRY